MAASLLLKKIYLVDFHYSKVFIILCYTDNVYEKRNFKGTFYLYTSPGRQPVALPSKVIILLGPTGIGKTAVSILLAEHLRTEIVSADSMQIYRHMDIGTAKPSPTDRRLVKHHMIDIVDPWQSFSAGQYAERVRPVLRSLLNDRKIPLIAGGTGLYIRAMTTGIFKGPSADWALRNELLLKERARPGYLYRWLQSIDPAASCKIMPADLRRTIRALEVCLKSHKAITELHKTSTEPFPYDFIKIGLTRHRKELYKNIEQRVDQMIQQGLEDEVKRVLTMIKEHQGGRPLESFSSMQAIGYKEMAQHFAGDLSLQEAVSLIRKRSKAYAKRQFIWFRKEEGIQWVDLSGLQEPHEMFEKVIKLIHA